MKEYVFKVSIVDGNVGKTSLVLQYTEEVLIFIRNDYRFKFCSEILSLPERGLKIKFQLWDLAGQPHFQFIRPPFYRGALLAILVFDITNRKSYDNIQLWVRETKNNVGDIPMILAGNKNDLIDQRVIPKSEGEALAAELNSRYFETSAKTGENLDEMMMHGIEEIIKRMNI